MLHDTLWWQEDQEGGRTPPLGISSPLAPKWSPDGKLIGFVAPSEQGNALWVVDPEGKQSRPVLVGALQFDWYRDSHRVVYIRASEHDSRTLQLLLRDLESGQEKLLHRGLAVEPVVTRDGSAVAFSQSVSHYNQNVFLLPMTRPGGETELPGPAGAPRQITFGEGLWHVHNGGFSPDGQSIVYTRDTDQGDIYVIENYH